jgi:hypothetical protein
MKRMRLVHSSDDVPAFATEAEEAAFWAEHAFADDWPTTTADVDPRMAAAKGQAVSATEAARRR